MITSFLRKGDAALSISAGPFAAAAGKLPEGWEMTAVCSVANPSHFWSGEERKSFVTASSFLMEAASLPRQVSRRSIRKKGQW